LKSKEAPDTGNEKKSSTSRRSGLPELTHLQFLIIDILRQELEGTPARFIRQKMDNAGVERQRPVFYNAMARLVERGLVEAWTEVFDVAGEDVSRTHYRTTPEAEKAWKFTHQFYSSRAQAAKILHPSAQKSRPKKP